MKIIGFDISTVSTGWAVFTDGPSLVEYGVIEISRSESLSNKILIFTKEIKKILKKLKPDIVIIEDTFVGKNVLTTKTLSKFAGVVISMSKLYKRNIIIYIPNAVHIRSVLFSGDADKDFVYRVLKKRYKLPKNIKNDVTDAIAAALFYFYKEKSDERSKI